MGESMRTDYPATWLRLYAEFATDPKVQMLSEADQRRYVMLLCLRCSNGDVTLHDEEVAFQLRVTEQEWADTKARLILKNLIDDANKPCAWEKRQRASDSSSERVAKHRAMHKKPSNGDVTLQKRQVETETETETEKETTTPFAPSDVIASAPKQVKPKRHPITFDSESGSFEGLNGSMAIWERAYPAVSIETEIAKAAAWLVANPANRKSNYARFLSSWLTRAQDRAPRVNTEPDYSAVR